jgi:hypothetical protein
MEPPAPPLKQTSHPPAQSAALIIRELPENSSGPPAAVAMNPYASMTDAPPTPPLPLTNAPPPLLPSAPPLPGCGRLLLLLERISARYQPGRKPREVRVAAKSALAAAMDSIAWRLAVGSDDEVILF